MMVRVCTFINVKMVVFNDFTTISFTGVVVKWTVESIKRGSLENRRVNVQHNSVLFCVSGMTPLRKRRNPVQKTGLDFLEKVIFLYCAQSLA